METATRKVCIHNIAHLAKHDENGLFRRAGHTDWKQERPRARPPSHSLSLCHTRSAGECQRGSNSFVCASPLTKQSGQFESRKKPFQSVLHTPCEVESKRQPFSRNTDSVSLRGSLACRNQDHLSHFMHFKSTSSKMATHSFVDNLRWDRHTTTKLCKQKRPKSLENVLQGGLALRLAHRPWLWSCHKSRLSPAKD